MISKIIPLSPGPCPNQAGATAVVVALLLTVLLGVMAFSMDTGYLYLKQNQYQNAVEAAALAGAWHLCENPEVIARHIAEENDIPSNADVLTAIEGFYDDGDAYADFSVYRNFVSEGDDDYPSDEYNNAIMVSISIDEPLLLGTYLEMNEARISAQAVAVARCAGLLSFGDDSSSAGILVNNWQNESSIEFQDMRMVQSNTDINFLNSSLASVSGDTRISATGAVSNCPDGGCLSGESPIHPSMDLDMIMEELRGKTDSTIDLTDDNFPSYDLATATGGKDDGNGNLLYRSTGLYVFCPHDGDHGGAVYYFENQGADTFLAIKGKESTEHARNFTVASENSIAFTSSAGNYIKLGGEGEDMVYFYTKKDIGGGMGGLYGALNHDFQGVTFWTGGKFFVLPDGQTYKLRVVAQEQIHLLSTGAYTPRETIFNADFGPPCPPLQVVLRPLEAKE